MSISSKLKEIIDEIIGEEQNICEQCGEVHEGECVKEASTTGNVAGYETPNAFGSDKEKENATNSTGYNVVKEALESKDIEIIKKLIRDVIGDVYRDIWIKRNSWK